MSSKPHPSCRKRREPRRLPVSLSILLLLTLFLSACQDKRTAPASLPPAAPTPPSPTPPGPAPPDPLLDQAAHLHRTGDYRREQQLLQSLLAGPPTAPAQGPQTSPASRTHRRAAILYRLALSYLAADNPQQALDTLQQLHRIRDALAAGQITLPAAPAQTVAQLLTNSLFLRGQALAGLHRHTQAAAAYRAFLQQRPQLSGVVEERIADTLLAQNQREQAAAALRRAADAAITPDEQVRLLERLAAVLEAGGRWRQAAAAYDQILARPDPAAPALDNTPRYTQTPIYRAGYLYRAGIAYAAAGDHQTAIHRWRAALTASPASDAAYLSLTQLLNKNAPVDPLLRGRIYLHAQAWRPALAAFQQYLAESPQTPAAAQAWLGAARARIGLQQWEKAHTALDRILTGFPDCPCLGQAWLARAQIAIAQNAPAQARRLYRTFTREHPDHPLAPEALWLSALSSLAAQTPPAAGPPHDLRTALHPLDEAVADLLRLADAYPGSPRAADGLAVAGIGAFQGGRYQLAANLFERMLTEYPDSQPDFATYWLGRARHARGETTKARAHWQALADRAPETYYGILARLDLHAPHPGRDIIPRMARLDTTAPALPGDDGSRAFAEAWLSGPDGFPSAQNTGAAAADRPWELPRAVLNDPDLVKGELLLALGRRAEGLQLLEQIFWRYHNDPAALYPLILRFHRAGANRLSLSAAHRLIELSPAQRIARTPLFIQRFAYPGHYPRLVEKQAAEFQFAPQLLYGLIYQESRFDPAARSYAGARGLMQILPGTGWEIARTLNYPNYTTELLDYPIVSIRFGAYYLRWARDYVAGNDVAALAGYNAGPHKAKQWLTRTDPDDALFIHNVPYHRTRRYLEGILICYAHYLRLYG